MASGTLKGAFSLPSWSWAITFCHMGSEGLTRLLLTASLVGYPVHTAAV